MPKGNPLRKIVPPATAYVGLVFAMAFVLGSLRVLWVAPRLGEVGAVLVEVPLVLAISWGTAGVVLRHWPLPRRADRVAMGALAFGLLMALELTLGGLGFGQTMAAMLAGMATPAGMIGLAGQIGFGLVPALRQPAG